MYSFHNFFPSNYIVKYLFCSNVFGFLLQGLQLCINGLLCLAYITIHLGLQNMLYPISFFISNLFYILFLFYFLASSHLRPLCSCCVFFTDCSHVSFFQFFYISLMVLICFVHFTKLWQLTGHFLLLSHYRFYELLFMVHALCS